MWSLLVQGITNVLGGWVKTRQVKAEGKVKVAIAQAEAQAKVATAERDWDTEALRQSQYSWKDEYLTIILSAPFVGSFFPVVQDHVEKGWEYVAGAPIWYQVAFLGTVAASFGLRWWFTRTNMEVMTRNG